MSPRLPECGRSFKALVPLEVQWLAPLSLPRALAAPPVAVVHTPLRQEREQCVAQGDEVGLRHDEQVVLVRF